MLDAVNIAVFDSTLCHLLVFKSDALKMSLIGGKKHFGELAYDAAYRLLYELCGISANDIILKPLCTVVDRQNESSLDVWFGALTGDVGIVCTEITPVWYDLSQDLSSQSFDGDGMAEYMIKKAMEAIKNAKG